MTDRELLELAAKAARIGGSYCKNSGDFFANSEGCRTGYRWDPLTDDGDAFRLMVKLGIEVKRVSLSRSVGNVVQAWYNQDGKVKGSACASISCTVSGCRYSATRRAIVLAAAEIGKKL